MFLVCVAPCFSFIGICCVSFLFMFVGGGGVFLRSVSFVPSVSSVSILSIRDFPFGFLERLFTMH